MNPPPTPPEEGSQCRARLPSSPPGRGQGWVGSWAGPLIRTMRSAISIYHRLPPFARDFVASIHGLRLRRWRYGSETDVLVKEAIERETWTREQWSAWRHIQLKRMLHHAAMSIPFYRDFWRTRGGGNRGGPFLELSNWPVLKKESVRKHPEAFLSLNSGKDLRMEHTSGTTGTPLKLWHDRT